MVCLFGDVKRMKIITIVDEDFINYKKACMYIAFPHCSFKCGCDLCQNSDLAKQMPINVSYSSIVNRYINNEYTNAVVFAGLEPFDDYYDLLNLIIYFRKVTDDDIVIYTGYNKDEIYDKIEEIKSYNLKNIIIKFGRYIPNESVHYDDVLGVNLASSNKYAERIS